MDDGSNLYIHAGAFQHRQAFRLDGVADVRVFRIPGGQHLVRLVENAYAVVFRPENRGSKQIGPFLCALPAVLCEVGNVLNHDAARENHLKAAPDVGLATAAGPDEQDVGLDAPLECVVGDDGGGCTCPVLGIKNQHIKVKWADWCLSHIQKSSIC